MHLGLESKALDAYSSVDLHYVRRDVEQVAAITPTALGQPVCPGALLADVSEDLVAAKHKTVICTLFRIRRSMQRRRGLSSYFGEYYHERRGQLRRSQGYWWP